MTDHISNAAAGQIKAFIERIERLHGERQSIADDIKDVYAEAKGNGFNTKALKHIVSLRSKDRNEVQEFEAIVSLYMDAIGEGR